MYVNAEFISHMTKLMDAHTQITESATRRNTLNYHKKSTINEG